MTARDAYEMALALIDEEPGSENEADYADKAPELIDSLQREIAFYEGAAPVKIESLDDELQISGDSVMRVMPYGLAALFALADRNADLQGEYSFMYRSLLRTVRPEEKDAEDEYDILSGMR